MFLQLLTLLGALGMFLYGMNMMSSGLQKTAGNRMRNLLGAMTSSPFKGVMTGLTITSIIQSSSATTVMVVGFVNASLLTLNQAIGVIMGANIGTTVTAWLVSLLGFKADISIFAVPLMAIGFIMSIAKSEKYRNISEFIIGFSLLFLGLSLMKNSVPDLRETPEILSFIQQWTGYGFGSVIIFLIFGTLLTLILQSSSATMALTLIMMSMGWIPFSMAAAMVLGENIGTTITANIAAAVGNPNARRAALAHTVFNVFGVIWALILFRPFLSLVGTIITWLGYPDPTLIDYSHTIVAGSAESTAALYGVSMLHTLFNTFNTCILIWFIPLIVRFVSWVIKSKPEDEEQTIRLKFINAGPMGTAELALEEARKEIIHFAQICRNGLDYIRSAVHATKEDEFEVYRKKLVKYEEIADRIEYEIASFLNALPQESISEDTRQRVKSMYKIIGELESLGDSGESISRIISRRNIHNKSFTAQHIEKIDTMLSLVDKAYKIMINNLETAENTSDNLRCAVDCEIDINDMRNTLREAEILKIEQNNTEYQSSVYYLDLISEIERMGDFMINISEALQRK
ncbi:MAG: Na/Pi cotransporter family protein [Rikenellaceae bacterium]|nr:Na/Pi cotransporter family protein [Rikenellaceae bacterium]